MQKPFQIMTFFWFLKKALKNNNLRLSLLNDNQIALKTCIIQLCFYYNHIRKQMNKAL